MLTRTFAVLVSYVCRDLPRQIPSVSVSWAGITVVERTLALMQKALEVDDSWRYFVNLGHVSLGHLSWYHGLVFCRVASTGSGPGCTGNRSGWVFVFRSHFDPI